MELNKKIQQLRKQHNLTQEELGERIFVSRTAISKWELGRGFPSIDSLKALAKFFSVPIDDLLSSEELIILAKEEQKQKTIDMQNLVFGILDCMTVLLFFLPLFGQTAGDKIITVPLLSLTIVNDFVWYAFIFLVALTVCFGVAELALQNWVNRIWQKSKIAVSFILSILLIILTIASRQPYPGVFLFSLFVLKGIIIWKSK